MSNLVGPETLDTPSTEGNCLYEAQALGAGIVTSPNVFVNGQQLRYSHAAMTPTPVAGIKINPLISAPCQPGNRVSINRNNKDVAVNGVFPLVNGDLCQLLGTDRPFVGPFFPGNVFFSTSK